jgi:hypothetical protein
MCTSGALRAERGVGDGFEWRVAVDLGFSRVQKEEGGF